MGGIPDCDAGLISMEGRKGGREEEGLGRKSLGWQHSFKKGLARPRGDP